MSDPRDSFGWGEELQRDPDPPPRRRGPLRCALLILAALLVLIVWAPLP